MAYTSEGAVAEWGGLLLHDVKHATPALAALVYGCFACSMAISRLFGDKLRVLLGDFKLIFCGGLLTAVGLITVMLSPFSLLCMAGYIGMGIGLSPIMPLVLSRAGHYPGIRASTASAVVSFCGYGGLLVVPPTLGFIVRICQVYLRPCWYLLLLFCF